MSDLRTAAQQALEALEWHYRQGHSNTIGGFRLKIDEKALRELRAALAQQAEPQGCATEEDCTKQPWCRIRGECQRKQAEPLNLSDPAVQKRLASQWGYVPAAAQAEPVHDQRCRAEPRSDGDFVCDCKIGECPGRSAALAQQAEPVEPVEQFDLNTMPGQADAHLRALLRYTENFYATAIEHGMRAGPTANAIAHVERAGKALHQIVHAQAKMLEPAQPAQPVEPVEPVAWVNQANLASARLTRDRGGQGDTHTWSETRSNYHGVPLYTAPPQRKPLPKHDQHCVDVPGYGLTAVRLVRAVERAHGIGEQS